MKVLVTGGAGFIGSHVADAYLAEGLDVVVVDDLSRGAPENIPAKARFRQADMRDPSAMQTVFAEEKPDLVNHHAAQIDVRKSVSDPASDAATNILASLQLLDLAVKHGVERLVYASTGGAIYGEPAVLPADEDTPVRPLAPYGVSKHTVEHYLFVYRALHGLNYVVLRYGNVYGPRQSSKGEAGVVAIFCEQMLAGVTPTIYGDGKKTRDYVEVSDVARASVQALKFGGGEIFNIATGVPTTDYEVFDAVRTALGIPPFEPRYAPRRPGEVEHIYLNADKARRQLDWQPKLGFGEGVKRTAAWFKDQR
ncbi:MAG: UDP-glucose 4-epimerase [Acidobacteria bacterium]|nr:MAG: UDP-glucose 4-epimerase [Acidobacteriota bacterium]PYV02056.1 MAG: UDP-glucose 4-epimerase [Acidobacteriota bacterium]PYV28285.1 MAG: UDP-glucose 4-epimerase [Acidobacteriota bacterium]